MSVNTIVPVILSGGSGRRLWPVSRSVYPKQFHNLLGPRSLLQETALRAEQIERAIAPVIVCNTEHRFIAQEQLNEVGIEKKQLLLEKQGKNTAPAITIAAMHVVKQDPQAVLIVLPADHVIPDQTEFRMAVGTAVDATELGRLVTFGIPPTYAETGYGYIQVEDSGEESFSVSVQKSCRPIMQFTEKPDQETAETYLQQSGYFWNSGMFVFPAKVLLDEMTKYQPDIVRQCQQAIRNARLDGDFVHLDASALQNCSSLSIDYALMEHTQLASMVPLQAGWSDIGSWNGVWDVSEKDQEGNVTRGDVFLQNTVNSIVFGSDRLIALVDGEDMAVVETDDAILISKRNSSQQTGDVVEYLKQAKRDEVHTHTTVYRPWGHYSGLDLSEYYQVKHLFIKPKARISLQRHRHRSEHWVVVKGLARVTQGENVFDLTKNESTFIPAGIKHQLENPGDDELEIIEVQTGNYFGEDDIERFGDDYGRT